MTRRSERSKPGSELRREMVATYAVLHEIVVRVENGFGDMVLHWRGGDHMVSKVKKNKTGKHRWTVVEDASSRTRAPDAGSRHCSRNASFWNDSR